MITEIQASTNKWRILGWGGAAALLLAPLIAMQFTPEVKWTPSDFAVAIILLGTTGVLLELSFRFVRNRSYRALAVLAIIAAFLLIWADGAVGIF